MPDLGEATVTAWLHTHVPDASQAWPPLLRAVERVGDAPKHLAALGAALDRLADANPAALATSLSEQPVGSDLSAVMAQLGAARVFRLLHWLAEIDLPDGHAVIDGLLRDDGTSGRSLRAAVTALTHRAMIHQMFSPARMAALEAACNRALQGTV